MNCEECPYIGGTKVPGEGSRILRTWDEETTTPGSSAKFITHHVERDNTGQYDVAICAMAPAREEVREGRVLVGRSGKILRGLLEQLGVTEFYACNILLCPITDDDLQDVAARCCRDVITEIQAVNPKLVIALGDFPYRTLTEYTGYTISEVEGRVVPSKVGPLLALKHPAYYDRRPYEFFDFIEGARCGLKALSNTYVQAGDPTYEVVTPDNLDRIRNEIDKRDDVAVDLETSGLHPYGWDPDYILEMGLSIDPHNHAYIVPAPYISEFKDLLEEKKGIFWNGSFDAAFLKQIGVNAYVDFDGMLAHYTMDERGRGHALKKVAGLYLGVGDWERDIKSYLSGRGGEISYTNIPTEKRYEYLSKDVTYTGLLKGVLSPDINQKVFNELLMPACRMFVDIEFRGMRVDPFKIMEMEPILSSEMNRLEKEIHDLTGEWINPNSPKQVKELVYGKMGLPVDPFFGASTGKDALAPYTEDPIIGRILEYRVTSKMRGTYIAGFARFVDRDFRIHPKMNLSRAVSGRLSSEEPSVMNIKRDSSLKSIFLADNVMGSGDISGNELRWYCINANDEELRSIFEAPITPENPRANDPHHTVTSIAYGPELAEEMRIYGKAVVFGRLFGRGRRSIEYQVGSEAIEKLIETVDALFPLIHSFREEVFTKMKSKGYLESFFGRRRRFPLITPESKHGMEREGVNFMQQSPGSDLMLYSMLYLWERKEELGIWPFWPVHDQITWDMESPDQLLDIKKILEDYCYELVEGRLKFPWEMSWGYDWSMSKIPKVERIIG